MIYVVDGSQISQRKPIIGTWAGGETVLLYSAPAEVPGFGRSPISFGTASILRNAPFSFFPGITRLHMPITGAGIRLSFREPAEEVVVPLYSCYQFAGDRPLDAELIDGPISAVNLLIQNGIAARLTMFRVPEQTDMLEQALASKHIGELQAIYLVSGSLTLLIGPEHILLHPTDTLIIEPSSLLSITVHTHAAPSVAIMACVGSNTP